MPERETLAEENTRLASENKRLKDRRDSLCEIMFSSSSWIGFPSVFLKLMSANEALVLSELISRYKDSRNLKNKKECCAEGWVEYSVDEMQDRLGMSSDSQARAIQKLQAANRLETEQRGMPAKRHFRINLVGVADEVIDLDRIEQNPALAPSKDQVSTSAVKQTVDEDAPAIDGSGFFPDEATTSTPSNFDMRCAAELNAAVIRNFKNDRRNDLKKWAVQFRLLRTRDNASKEQIKEVLVWYVAQDWKSPYTIAAFSGKSFREKFFDKLLPAMLKDKDPKTRDGDDSDGPIEETVIIQGSSMTQAQYLQWMESEGHI